MAIEVQNTKDNIPAALAGLTVAWGGTVLLISPLMRAFADPFRPLLLAAGVVLYWMFAAAVISIVLLWEKQPLRSLWLQRVRWQSAGWGFLLALCHYTILLPVGEWVRRSSGLPGFSAGMEEIIKYPFWYRMLAVVGAGLVEEILFRGYTITRLIKLTGSIWIAALLALVGFSALHVPMWGWGFVVGGLFSGAAGMAFFIWRRDLFAMMVFHTITDAVGLVIAPEFSHWWENPSMH